MALIIVKAQVSAIVRQMAKETKVDNITSDFMPALDRKVRLIIEESVLRAKKNGRRTLMARDV